MIQIIELRDISLNGRYILPNERDRRVQLRLPTPGNKNVGPLLHEPLRGRQAMPLFPPVITATLPFNLLIR